jgi:hypothetical protein
VKREVNDLECNGRSPRRAVSAVSEKVHRIGFDPSVAVSYQAMRAGSTSQDAFCGSGAAGSRFPLDSTGAIIAGHIARVTLRRQDSVHQQVADTGRYCAPTFRHSQRE